MSWREPSSRGERDARDLQSRTKAAADPSTCAPLACSRRASLGMTILAGTFDLKSARTFGGRRESFPFRESAQQSRNAFSHLSRRPVTGEEQRRQRIVARACGQQDHPHRRLGLTQFLAELHYFRVGWVLGRQDYQVIQMARPVCWRLCDLADAMHHVALGDQQAGAKFPRLLVGVHDQHSLREPRRISRRSRLRRHRIEF